MFIKQSLVKTLVRENGKQSSKEYLVALDRKVYEIILESIRKCTGTRLKTLDQS